MSENAPGRTDQVRTASLLSSQSDNNGGGVGQCNLAGDGRPATEWGDVADERRGRRGQRSVQRRCVCPIPLSSKWEELMALLRWLQEHEDEIVNDTTSNRVYDEMKGFTNMADLSQQDLLGALDAAISLCNRVGIQPTSKRLQTLLAVVGVHVSLEQIVVHVQVLYELSNQEKSEE